MVASFLFSEVTQEQLGLAIMKRDNLLEEAKSSNNEPDWVKYRNQRDHVSIQIFVVLVYLLKKIKLLILKITYFILIHMTGSESD